jgi:DNA-binding response OmpR family regulator
MQRILLIEDSADVHDLVEASLSSDVVEVTAVTTAAQALSTLKIREFDLILLDLRLPDRDGFELYVEIQKQPLAKKTAVFILTGKADASDKVTAFSLGAEDYIVKPFQVLEFKARVEAKLRRIRHAFSADEALEIGGLEISLPLQKVYFKTNAGKKLDLDLSPIEFKLFFHLAKHPGQVYSREQLLSSVWGSDVHVYDRTVDAHICTLRRKLGERSRYVESVPGVGYRFIEKEKLQK